MLTAAPGRDKKLPLLVVGQGILETDLSAEDVGVSASQGLKTQLSKCAHMEEVGFLLICASTTVNKGPVISGHRLLFVS
jgi:hypothetical protein